jgi:hypothetical protein
MANPMVRCFPEDYHNKKARNGSIETLMEASMIQTSRKPQNGRIGHYK